MAKNLTCENCGAENAADYTFCHCCRAISGATAKKPAVKKPAPKTSAKKSAARK